MVQLAHDDLNRRVGFRISGSPRHNVEYSNMHEMRSIPTKNGAADIRLLSIAAVSEATSLSRATIYRAIDAGLFPRPLKLAARRIGWRVSDLTAWLDSRQETGGVQ